MADSPACGSPRTQNGVYPVTVRHQTVSGTAADRHRHRTLRRPRDRHTSTRAAAAPRPRRQERDGAMNGSRARRHPRRTGAGAGDEESAGPGGAGSYRHSDPRGVRSSRCVRAPGAWKHFVRLLLLLLMRTSTERRPRFAPARTHCGSTQAARQTSLLSRMRIPPVAGASMTVQINSPVCVR